MQITDTATDRGVTAHDFTVDGPREPVPGVLWTPAGTAGPRPLVLIGHGGSQHKRSPNIAWLGRKLAAAHGIAAAAIDLPRHGDRMPEDERGLSLEEHQKVLRRRMTADTGHEAAARNAVDDWTTTLDALQARDDVGTPVGYWGVSMGTRFGVPLIAHEPRITAAVLGLFGWWEGPRLAGYDDLARQVTIPLRFLVQWHDELVRREWAFALFDLFGTPAKTLHANPGRHVEIPRAEFFGSADFLAHHLTADAAAP